jgi:hypothetical protein
VMGTLHTASIHTNASSLSYLVLLIWILFPVMDAHACVLSGRSDGAFGRREQGRFGNGFPVRTVIWDARCGDIAMKPRGEEWTEDPKALDSQQWIRESGIRFQENRGQIVDDHGDACPDVLFTANAAGTRLFFRRNGISTVFSKVDQDPRAAMESDEPPLPGLARRRAEVRRCRLDMTLLGSNPEARILAEEEVAGTVNYYYPHCPDGIRGIREFKRIVYENIYDRIDLELLSAFGKLKYNFIVRPGGRISDIRMQYHGATDIRILEGGALRINTTLGTAEEAAPVTYAGKRATAVDCRFVLSENTVAFDVGDYDIRQTLIIDPWSTYYGGSGFDNAAAISIDGSSNVVVGGSSSSADFPVLSAYQTSISGNSDAVIMKFDGNGNRLWATYYGGTGRDEGWNVATDASGNIALIGITESTNFPVSAGAFQSVNKGGTDTFIIKFNSSGVRQWATYYGGSASEWAIGMAIDGNDNIIMSGYLKSSDFPVLNSFQSVKHGADDAFILKLTSSGARLWSTYFGGDLDDVLQDIQIDAGNNIVVAGYTRSSNFPVFNAFQSTLKGGTDGVVVKFNANGVPIWSTYLGGTSSDMLTRVAMDAAGDFIICGLSNSSDFPVFNASQATNAGGYDGVIIKMSAGGARIWATYFGGTAYDNCGSLAVDGGGNIFAGGETLSTNLPVANALQPTNAGSQDLFIGKFDGNAVRIWATYYGGTLSEVYGNAATDNAGDLYFVGQSASANFPVTPGAFQTVFGGGTADAIIVKLGCVAPAALVEPGNALCCAGSQVRFAVRSSGFPSPAIQWQVSTNNGASWSELSGETDTSLVFNTAPLMNGQQYRAVFTNACGTVASSAATLTVEFPPSVTVQPADVLVCTGEAPKFKINATGSGVSYRWQEDQGSGFADLVEMYPYAGVTSSTITITGVTAASNGYLYRCIVTGVCVPSDTSDVAKLMVIQPPSITAHPSDTLICAGRTTSFSVAAAGAGLVFQWQEMRGANFVNLSNTAPYSGTTTSTLTIIGVDIGWNGQRYRCIVSGSCQPRDTTDEAVLSVSPPPSITSSVNDVSVCAEGRADFTVSADGQGLSYAWQMDRGSGFVDVPNAPPFTGGLSAILSIAGAGTSLHGCRFRCIVTGVCTPPAVSNSAILTVLTKPPAVVNPSGSITTCEGVGVPLVADTGSGLRYQWLRNSLPISGASASRYLAMQSGVYRVVVSDGNGCFDSSATITVNVSPRPAASVSASGPTSFCTGGSVSLIAGSGAGWTYTWLWNDNPISGETSAVFTALRDGTYKVVARNLDGCIDTSAALQVTVHPLPTARILGPSSICPNSEATYRLDLPAGLATDWTIIGGLPLTPLTGDSIRVQWNSAGSGSVRAAMTFTPTGCRRDTLLRVTIANVLSPIIVPGKLPIICMGDSLRLDAGTGYAQYLWSTGATTQTIMVGVPGEYTVAVRDMNGCAGTSQPLSVRVKALPVPTITAAGDTIICPGDSVRLEAVDGYISYLWSNGTGSRTIVIDEPGDYSVTVVDSGGCTGTSLPIAVIMRPAPNVGVDGMRSVCINAPTSYKALDSTARAYAWSTSDGSILSSADRRDVVVRWNSAGAGSLHLSMINASGCRADTTIIVEVRSSLAPIIIPDRLPRLCEGDSVILDAGDYASYQWNSGQSTRSIVVTSSGKYFVDVADAGGCMGRSDTIVVSVSLRPVVVISGRTEFCEGDSAVLDAGGGHAVYVWSTGATTNRITVTQSGVYTVTVTDGNGCTGASQMSLTVHPRPTVIITQQGGDLLSTPAATYQWYRNGNRISGATTQIFTPADSGNYSVSVTNQFGCLATSPSFAYRLNKAETMMRLECPATSSVVAGAILSVPLVLVSSSGLNATIALACSARLRFDRTVLVPLVQTIDPIIDGRDAIITVEMQREPSVTQGMLLAVPFMTTLGETPCTTIHVDSLWWRDGSAQVALQNPSCEICIEVCREGGARLFGSTGRLALMQNHPNPFNAITRIEYELIESGMTELYVIDAMGRRIASLLHESMIPGRYSRSFDASQLSTGVYLCVLKTPSTQVVRILEVVK